MNMTRFTNPEPLYRSVRHDGTDVFYLESGGGAPLLLIHDGAPGADAWSCWHALLPALAAGRRVIAPDVHGYGRNATPSRGGATYSHSDRVMHLVGLMDALELAQVQVFGFSLGGAVAISLALEVPERISRLVTAAPAGLDTGIPEALGPLMAYRGQIQQMRDLMVALGGPRFETDEQLVAYRTALSNRPECAGAWQAAMEWIGRNGLAFGREQIAAVSCPTLLMAGAEDPIISRETALTSAAAFVDGTPALLEGCGHWLPFECPESMAERALAFLSA